MVPVGVLTNPAVSATAKRVWAAYASFGSGWAPTGVRVAERAGVSLDTVQRTLPALVAARLLLSSPEQAPAAHGRTVAYEAQGQCVPFIKCPKALLADSTLTSATVMTYLALASFGNGSDSVYPARSKVATRAGIRMTACRDAIRRLRGLGWITCAGEVAPEKRAGNRSPVKRYLVNPEAANPPPGSRKRAPGEAANPPTEVDPLELDPFTQKTLLTRERETDTEESILPWRSSGAPLPEEKTKSAPEEQKMNRTLQSSEIHAAFLIWYEAYPVKQGRDRAEHAYRKVLKEKRTGMPDPVLFLLERSQALVAFMESERSGGCEPPWAPHPATWLSEGRWGDVHVSRQKVSAGSIGISVVPRSTTKEYWDVSGRI
jgi:hypothetical protein